MTISTSDLYGLACSLAKSQSEVELRAAISRAYYGAYHACKAWHAALPAMGRNAGPAGGVHQELINRLKNPDPSIGDEMAKVSRSIGAQLDVMRSDRKIADYNILESSVDAHVADNACRVAELILKKLA